MHKHFLPYIVFIKRIHLRSPIVSLPHALILKQLGCILIKISSASNVRCFLSQPMELLKLGSSSWLEKGDQGLTRWLYFWIVFEVQRTTYEAANSPLCEQLLHIWMSRVETYGQRQTCVFSFAAIRTWADPELIHLSKQLHWVPTGLLYKTPSVFEYC